MSQSLSADAALVERKNSTATGSNGAIAADISIPFDKFRLDNGLTVIVHENRRAPIVSINIWYQVGAKDEPAGKTGFAHLFEHLMFGGSANVRQQFINALTDAGASDLNGTTNHDRTNYYETVPTSSLDYALFAESDRMGHFYETINQETLDAQRGVVQNEKRQTEGQPYGLVNERIVLGTHPVGHPYAHTVLGSMEDLDKATLDDVRSWFKTYYAPSNAVITLAGDIDLATAKEKVTKYFGHIPPGQPLARPQKWIAKMTGVRREVLEDRVPHPRLQMIWNIPEYGHPDLVDLSLAAYVLTSGMSARLRKRLVLDEKLATGVGAHASGGIIAGQFSISATPAEGVELETIECVINEELARLFSEGPTAAELERARTRQLSHFLRHLDGTSGIADMLSMNEVQLGTPDGFQRNLTRLKEATPDSVRRAAVRWLSDGVYILNVVPFPALRPRESGVDRSKVPAVTSCGDIKFPALERDTLSNGLKIVLASRHELPLVHCSMMFDVGALSEPANVRGVAQMMAGLLPYGAGERNSLQFTEAKLDIGAEISAGAGFDSSHVGMSAMKSRLQESLQLFADMILRPRFPEADVERERVQTLHALARETISPGSVIGRVLPGLLLPAGHPYARPMSGFGSPAHLERLTRDHIVQFHSDVFRPQSATLVVVGDTTMKEMKPMLERCFSGWPASAAPSIAVPPASPPKGTAIYLIDKPDTPQAIVSAATLFPNIPPEESFPARYLNKILGGGFSSRLNMNLREEKHWTYGARTEWHQGRGPNFYVAQAAVQIDKTAAAMVEIRKELADIAGPRPVTADELGRCQRYDTLKLGGRVATLGALAGAIEGLVSERLPDDYWARFGERVRAVTVDSVNEAASSMIHAGRLVWVVVGDLARIESDVRALGIGPVQVIDGRGDDLYPLNM
ncbi:MAG: pitrilysin family protein [Gammaproteobacteria bacterium]